MATIPAPATAAVAGKITAAGWNTDVRDESDFQVINRPLCHVVQGTAQAGIATATFGDITFVDADILDRDGQHSTSTNTARIVIGTTLGWYRVSGVVAWPSSAAGTVRKAQIALNGTAVNGSETAIPVETAAAQPQSCVTPPILVQATVSTDFVTIQGFQDSGGATVPSINGAHRCSLLTEWVGS